MKLKRLFLSKMVRPLDSSTVSIYTMVLGSDRKLSVDRFELVCQCIEYEKKYNAKKDLKEFLHVRRGIKNEFVKKWAEDALREREAFWAAAGVESVVEN